MEERSETYDVVVIGSGMGGLSAASLLAGLHGRRVCVLERHSTPGGFTHSFRRPGGWEWDVGLHYVGDMAPGALPRRLMDRITGGAVTWQRLPEPFEQLHFPDFGFAFQGNPEAFAADLAAAFPAERAAIGVYLRDVRREARRLQTMAGMGSVPAPVVRGLTRVGLLPDFARGETTRDALARRFGDARLRAILAAQWGDIGLPPGESPFCLHALIADHYLHGAWYPKDGAAGMARGATAVIEAAGGSLRTRHTVGRILLDGGRAVGVEAHTRRAGRDHTVTIRAGTVISDAGAINTFARLLPPEAGAAEARRLAPFAATNSAVQLFLGLSASPEALGLNGANVWFFDGTDHDALARRDWPLTGRPGCAFLSFPSLRGGNARGHTAEIIAPAATAAFAAWRGQAWQHRAPDYKALKAAIAEALIGMVERRYPGFAALVVAREVATPLTVEHFTGSHNGAIYGLPCSAERLARIGVLGVRTGTPGLLLTGADALFPGIVGAAVAGAAAAGASLGRLGFARLMAALRP
jgi:phytoene dehydrogenase-like protein